MNMTAWPAARRPAALLAALVTALLLLLTMRPALAAAATETNTMALAVQRARVRMQLRDWPRLTYPHLTVYYAPGLAQDATIVAATAQQSSAQVFTDFGLPADTPAVLVVVSAWQLAADTGTTGTVGDFYKGVIWLLAPSAFLPSGPGLQARYAQVGPVVHELTHLADDLAAGGLPPVWFDEGLAQYEDWRLTGYVWTPAGSGFGSGTYSWQQITSPGFYQLPNLALGFRQALALTAAVCRTGPGVCTGILHDVRSGMTMDAALRAAIGPTALRALENGTAWRPGEAPQMGTVAGPRP
jgi:hypothetical protein